MEVSFYLYCSLMFLSWFPPQKKKINRKKSPRRRRRAVSDGCHGAQRCGSLEMTCCYSIPSFKGANQNYRNQEERCLMVFQRFQTVLSGFKLFQTVSFSAWSTRRLRPSPPRRSCEGVRRRTLPSPPPRARGTPRWAFEPSSSCSCSSGCST